MPKRSRKEDANETAFRVVQDSLRDRSLPAPTSEPTPARKKRKNPAAVALGRKGGKIGGKRRAANMTAEQRSAASRMAAEARWGTRGKS